MPRSPNTKNRAIRKLTDEFISPYWEREKFNRGKEEERLVSTAATTRSSMRDPGTPKSKYKVQF